MFEQLPLQISRLRHIMRRVYQTVNTGSTPSKHTEDE